MKIILTAICTIASIAIFAQTTPPNIQWQKSLGGSGYDQANSIQQTTDGGYIVAGYNGSNDGDVIGNHGSFDYWIVKLNKSGRIQWQKSLGGSGYDEANSIQQTTDGGYIVAGYSGSNNGDVISNHGGYDYWIVKLDTIGNIQWQKSLGGSSYDYANTIRQTADSGYIVDGTSFSNDGDISGNHGNGDYWIVKLNKNGGIQWQKSLGGSAGDGVGPIRQTEDGGYIVAGTSYSNDGDVTGNHGKGDYWIIKLKKHGDIQWQKSLGGSAEDEAFSIQQTAEGGYIVAGYSTSKDGDVTGKHRHADYWIVKLKKYGDIQWQKSLGGSYNEGAKFIKQTEDSGYIVAGLSYSNDGDVSGHHGDQGHTDSWIVKLKKYGDIQWQKSLGGSNEDGAHSIQQTTDGGYIVAGYSYSNDGDISGNHGIDDYWIVKLGKDSSNIPSPETTTLSAGVQNKDKSQTKNNIKNFTVYPNPAKDILYVQTNSNAVFSLINSSGKIVLTKPVNGNGNINISALPAGNYFLKNNATDVVQKVVIEK